MSASILVGVDGSSVGLRALDLAVREAELRDRPVRVVCVAATPARVPECDQAIREALERVARASPVVTSGVLLAGDPATRLVAESREATLVVVGAPVTAGLGPVARQVAACAAGPVLVARGELDGGGGVLVGVDASTEDDPVLEDAALGFAFEEAALRGTRLVALHAWTGPVARSPAEMLPLVYEPGLTAADLGRALTEALSGWRGKYPEVPVEHRVVPDRPARALVVAGADAALLVVGAHGRRGGPPWLVGSVTHLVLHQARCPVAVARPR